MADDFVDGRAVGFGEVVVVERGWISLLRLVPWQGLRLGHAYVTFYASVVHNLINLVGGDAGLDSRRRNIEDFS